MTGRGSEMPPTAKDRPSASKSAAAEQSEARGDSGGVSPRGVGDSLPCGQPLAVVHGGDLRPRPTAPKRAATELRVAKCREYTSRGTISDRYRRL